MTKEKDTTSLIADKDFSKVIEETIGIYSEATFDRAFPSINDNLKPVARRILYTMKEQNLTYFKKLAYTVGLTMGYYHPHGDSSIADTAILLSQDFTVNEPLFEAQGNNGSAEGDRAAAARYLEMKLSKFAQDVITDEIDKYSIEYVPNYDDTKFEPTYLPTKIPLALLNGVDGIGEAFIVSIPPHNLRDIVRITKMYINNKNIPLSNLVRGFYPDFPLGGEITNKSEIEEYYSMEAKDVEESLQNKRSWTIQFRAKIEFDRENDTIIITELPYNVTFQRICDKILYEVKERGNVVLSNIINTGNRKKNGKIQYEIICKKNSNLMEIANMLYEKAQLTHYSSLSFMFNCGQRLSRLSIKDIIEEWYNVRVKTKQRKFNYEHSQLQNDVHIHQGLKLIHDKKDAVIKTITESDDKADATQRLVKKFGLSPIQAQGICDMTLSFLTRVNAEKLDDDIRRKLEQIEKLEWNLDNIDSILIDELDILDKKYGRDRKTSVINLTEDDRESIHISNGALLYNKDSIGIFNTSALADGKIITNSIKSYRIDKRTIKEIVHYHPIKKDINGVILFLNDGTARRLKLSEIPCLNTWIQVSDISNQINAAVPIYDDEELEIITISDEAKIKRFLAKEIQFTKVNTGNVKSAYTFSNNTLMIILYNQKGEYLYIDKNEIPVLSRTASGNSIGFDIKDDIYIRPIDETIESVGVLYADEDGGYFYGLDYNDLRSGRRTNKPRSFVPSLLRNLEFTGIIPMSSENKSNTITVFIGPNQITSTRSRLLKVDESRKIRNRAFGGITMESTN